MTPNVTETIDSATKSVDSSPYELIDQNEKNMMTVTENKCDNYCVSLSIYIYLIFCLYIFDQV